MKKVLFSAAMFATIAGVMLMTSCKKQQDTIVKKDAAPFEQGVSGSEQKIIDFIDSYSAFKKGAKVEGESVSLEEARWQWETTFNYCYGFTQDEHSDMRHDTVCVALPKTDPDGNIAYVDILQTYADIVDAVRECYNAIDIDGKFLKYVTISFDNGTKDGDKATVVINTGKSVNGIDPQGPFNVGECYLWGAMGNLELANAAPGQIKSKVFDYDLRMMYYYTPCPTCTTWIDSINSTTYCGNTENSDSLFYVEGLTKEEVQNYQICYDDLNKEYYYIVKRGHWGQPTNLYGVDWYYYTDVFSYDDIADNNLYSIWHYFNIVRCTRHWRHGDTPYPISIDEEQER
ncbi:MAG: hypothetical protein MJZ52_08015 [Bacteroidales bacterium]|nr:hypothetical protein [Bacteroidales bacterium]